MTDKKKKHGSNPELRQAILREVLLRGPVTRKELSVRLGMAPSSLSRLSRALVDEGVVKELPEQPGEFRVRPGRRFQPMQIDPQGGCVLGIAIAPTVQTVALADLGLDIVASAEFRIEPIADAELVIRRLAQESRDLIGAHVEDRSRLLGGLLMVTAEVDPVPGIIREAPYLGWGRYPARARLADLLNLPMQVRMLMPTVVQAEMLFGAAKGRSNVLGLLCGMGIGATVFVHGRPAADGPVTRGGIGTMKVIGEDGREATIDELASGLGILRRLHGVPAAPAVLSQLDLALHEAIERDRAGDAEVAAAMTRAGRELGRLAAQCGHLVSLETLLVAGPLAMAPAYMGAIRDALAEDTDRPMEVVTSSVTGAAGGWWASCAVALYEYLVERPLELPDPGASPD